MDGLCHSAHHPTPGLVELKKVFQAVEARLDGRTLFVSNEYDFQILDHSAVNFKVEDSEARVACWSLDFSTSGVFLLGHRNG